MHRRRAPLWTGRLLRAGIPALALALGAMAVGVSGSAASASAPATYTQYALATGGPGPAAITAVPGGDVWFTVAGGASAIGRITGAGAITLFSGLGSQVPSAPGTITAGPDGNVWFVEQRGGSFHASGAVGSITPRGTISETTSGLQNGRQPTGIAAGADGNLWVTESGGPGSTIVRLSPSGSATVFTDPALAKAQASDPTLGPDGNVWFLLSGGGYGATGAIGRITPGGVVSVFTAGLRSGGRLSSLASGPNGELWFTQSDPDNGGVGWVSASGTITELSSAPWANTSPVGIAAAADGNLYVAESAGRGAVVELTTAGTLTTVTSSPDGQPAALSAQTGGDVWVAQTNANSIGRVSISAPSTATGSSGATGVTGTTGSVGAPVAGAPPAANEPSAPAAPVLGVKVLITPHGFVRVRIHPHGPFVRLSSAGDVPVGALVDARSGTIRLVSSLGQGRTQSASVGRGEFTIAQPKGARGMTLLSLSGGSFARCPRASALAHASSVRSPKRAAPHQVIRRLWSSDNHGRFQTHGHDSVATVRGTEWLTVDRCDGTLTRVLRGVVSVRPHGSRRAVTVTAGHSYLAAR